MSIDLRCFGDDCWSRCLKNMDSSWLRFSTTFECGYMDKQDGYVYRAVAASPSWSSAATRRGAKYLRAYRFNITEQAVYCQKERKRYKAAKAANDKRVEPAERIDVYSRSIPLISRRDTWNRLPSWLLPPTPFWNIPRSGSGAIWFASGPFLRIC